MFLSRLLITLIILSLFFSLKAPSAIAQYCTPDTYCIGSQTCDLDGLCNEFCINCASGCDPGTGTCYPTYTISGTVYVDTNGNGVQNLGESGYNSGITQILSLSDGDTEDTNLGGSYSFIGKVGGNYTLTLNVPAGYKETTTNPQNIFLSGDTTVNFGIQLVPSPDCPGGISIDDPTLNAGESTTTSVTSCDDVEDPDDGNPPPRYDWDPPSGDDPQCSDGINNDADGLIDNADPDCHTGGDPTQPYNPTDDDENPGSDSCNDGGTGTPTNTSTSSTSTYTAPACPTSPLVCTVTVDVSGPGGTTTYNSNISVASTYSITTNIRLVSDASSCIASSGDPYSSSVSVNTSGGDLPVGGDTNITSTGTTTFACLAAGDYTVILGVPSGYAVVGRDGGVDSGSNAIQFNGLASNQTATFCIAPIDPWFQTDLGDVRYLNIDNPVPAGKYASLGENINSPQTSSFPGIVYSSSSNAQLGAGSVSSRNWVVNNEYSYNADTENRNGGMSYDFYKSKAKQDGVTITSIAAGTFVQNDINESQAFLNNEGGVFEANGDLTINNYTHTNGKRIVMLVNGDVTINDPSISIPVGQGLLIIAAKGNITVDDTVGTATLNSTTTQLDGYYTAQGNITLESIDNICSTGVSDKRLNIGGALIAHSLKPFSTTGAATGTVDNNRSLCGNSIDYPSLYISSRPDFLVQLTDFYKTSYTKWKEDNP